MASGQAARWQRCSTLYEEARHHLPSVQQLQREEKGDATNNPPGFSCAYTKVAKGGYRDRLWRRSLWDREGGVTLAAAADMLYSWLTCLSLKPAFSFPVMSPFSPRP
ncbi:hypothetical protein Vretimale_13177 [Volvox reticuliferus]|uniref:Uncharacterized protein n=1 Tax=Volvox reticuliferus TaxID=1737510 RepID=A0A8J4CNB0_9CHLO|nr:hypothetical protein Vretifemale_14104 [Volvox reticuliferus]GIM09342.1 hypothetical protein Vretimale_13177 [Volvox reticuliferus]